MQKLTPLNNRVIVTSRGIKEELEGGIVVPDQFLVDSDVCTTEDGLTVIRKTQEGYPLGSHRYILFDEEVLAVMVDDEWKPTGKMVMVRKCIDPEDDSGLISLSDRKTKFAEILAAGAESGLETDIGSLAYVNDKVAQPQKVEDTIDDWLVSTEYIEFIIGE